MIPSYLNLLYFMSIRRRQSDLASSEALDLDLLDSQNPWPDLSDAKNFAVDLEGPMLDRQYHAPIREEKKEEHDPLYELLCILIPGYRNTAVQFVSRRSSTSLYLPATIV